jgi:nucleotide-binding universal stress UspA family protein
MFPFRKILFPVDYSAPCEAVVPYVKEMVRHFSADLTLVHAYGPEALAFSELAITDPDLPDEARTHEQQRLRDFALKTFPGQHVETITQLGEAGTVLHGIVQHQGTDLVMLPTHGRGPIRRFLLGSVAAKVLHDIGAAVWTGVGAALIDHAPRMPYESILCALDDSDEAQGVLKAAAAFADNYRAQLWLVQVVQMPPVTMEIDFSPYKKDLIDASEDRLQELKAQLGINALHTVIEGAVADGVRQEAVRRRADLIITGRGHAQAAVGRIWSNVYPIVREAPCPVLSL